MIILVVLFRLKDTGFKNTALTGAPASFKVNAGYPIPLYLVSYSYSSKGNRTVLPYNESISYFPEFVSKEFTRLSVEGRITKDIQLSKIFIYDKLSNNYVEVQNPPITAIVALFEQMLVSDSHLDLYFSDASEVSVPQWFTSDSLYWLSFVYPNTAPDALTKVRHLNVVLEDYTIKRADIEVVEFTLNFLIVI